MKVKTLRLYTWRIDSDGEVELTWQVGVSDEGTPPSTRGLPAETVEAVLAWADAVRARPNLD